MPRRLLLSLLLGLTVVTLALGAWLWAAQRRENAQRIAEQSQPSLEDASRSLAPDFSLQTLDGTTVRLADLRGKVVLINFWATWCPPCQAEMPDLDALHREYSASQNFVVLGVDVEEKAATVAAFVEQHKLSFPIVLDPDGRVTTDRFAVRPLPTSFIIDREGFVRDTWYGQIAHEAMVARLKRVW